MANTYKKIQTVTVGSGGSSTIAFTSIPQTYTDLKIVLSVRSDRNTGTSSDLQLRFNGSSANYSRRTVQGNGTAASSFSDSGASFGSVGGSSQDTDTASVFTSSEVYIPNYTSANYKSYSADTVRENNATSGGQFLVAGLWSDTAAITSITFYVESNTQNFKQYSTATLYGVSDVTAASNAYATGGIITYDDTYVYHTFPWSGTFTPTRSLNVDYLVVAGGGSGGGANDTPGGGGGAGGVRCTVGATGGGGSLESQLAVTATAYTVTVGAGGAGSNSIGTNGSNSVFSSITSTGGGGGGRDGSNPGGGSGSGLNGGSGGGSSYINGIIGNGTANQGYNGGAGAAGTNQPSGGGGGAGAVGANGSGSTGGSGGNGITTSISGTSTVYAGGGGGSTFNGGTAGTGGTGGGGNGARLTTGSAGTANRGGGGGATGGNAGGSGYVGGAGGSGIVIVRYAR